MPRLTHTLAEWMAIAKELRAPNRAAALPGLAERVQDLLAQAPDGWPEQSYTLELDDACAESVRAVHAALAGSDPAAWQRAASVAEADAIVREHQRRP